MTTMGNLPEVVTRQEWLAARKELLAKEKALTRARDEANADRRRLPMVHLDSRTHSRAGTYGRGLEEFHNGYPYLDLTALGRQEAWEEPKGRAVPLGLQVGGPAIRLPDEYDT